MEENNRIDLFVYIYKALRVIKKTWAKAIVLVLVSCACFVGISVVRYTPTYTSKITFSVIKEYNGSTSFSYNKDATDKLVGSFLTIINSDLMVTAICNDLKVSSIPATYSIERIGTTNLFSVYASSSNAKNAKDVLDALARNYTKISKVALNDASLTVIEEPILQSEPSNRIQFLNLILKGLIVGSAIYLLYVVLFAMLRQSITKDGDIKYHLHSKCICRIPNVKLMKGKKLLINEPIRIRGELKDCFHKVRLEIENEKIEYGHNVFMITSTLAHEGKSTVAANTVLSLAQKGNRVLLVDFDLRNPTQHKNFDLSAKIGKIIKLKNTQLNIYRRVDGGNIDVLCAAKAEEKASEILAGNEVQAIVKEASEMYDYVIIDTPPIQMMADTLVVAGYADSIILVIKDDYANVVDIKDALQSLEHVNINLLGCVLNQCEDGGIFSNYYGYRYGYGYGYGHYSSSYRKNDNQ